MTLLVWEWLERPGLDVATVSRAPGEDTLVDGHAVVSWDGELLDLRYRLACDSAWVFREVTLRTELAGAMRQLTLHRDPDGWRAEGEFRPDLADAIDIDIMATPMTNTLPIRRAAWSPGQRQDFTMAYIRLPDLVVVPVKQRYTALSPGRFRYELVPGASYAAPSDAAGYHRVDDGFSAELAVDGDGFVLSYPPYWQRRRPG
ncbi:MAG: putative glycolipid-binding domain-containing protein [Rhizobacter sp.]